MSQSVHPARAASAPLTQHHIDRLLRLVGGKKSKLNIDDAGMDRLLGNGHFAEALTGLMRMYSAEIPSCVYQSKVFQKFEVEFGGKSLKQLQDVFYAADWISNSEWPWQVLRKAPVSAPQRGTFAVIEVGDLGFVNLPTLREAQRRTLGLGHQFCPADAIPLLCASLSGTEKYGNGYWYTMMETILDEDGDRQLITMGRGVRGGWIDGEAIRFDKHLELTDRFVIMLESTLL